MRSWVGWVALMMNYERVIVRIGSDLDLSFHDVHTLLVTFWPFFAPPADAFFCSNTCLLSLLLSMREVPLKVSAGSKAVLVYVLLQAW